MNGGNRKKLKLVDNKNSETEFYLGKEVTMFENYKTEFKNFTRLDARIAANYICAFLNSEGGKLFFGIDDNGIVQGMQCQRYHILKIY